MKLFKPQKQMLLNEQQKNSKKTKPKFQPLYREA
jgi:hypothetical protein